jgi:O-methyltransferase domain
MSFVMDQEEVKMLDTHAPAPSRHSEESINDVNRGSQAEAVVTPLELLARADGLVIHQALYAVAKLGVADLLVKGPRATTDIAPELNVNELALYRLLRTLASEGVFEEVGPRTFVNTGLSQFLRTGTPGSIRALMIFRGSKHFFAPFGEILYSVQTGDSARTKIDGRNGFESLRRDPELAAVFDDAMTNLSELVAPAIASAYDFAQWGSVMDVGGGNGVLLAEILKVHTNLHGVLADQPHVLQRARQRGFLGGGLAERAAMKDCDFFRTVPSGCRAYLIKNVLVDWNDEQACTILRHCRQAVPKDGALLVIDFCVAEDNLPSRAKLADLTMLMLTGGRVRTIQEYRDRLARGGFRLKKAIPVPGELSILEALPD